MVIDKCKTCALYKDGICIVTKREKDPENDYCSSHKRSVRRCSICGKLFLEGGIYDNGQVFCEFCYSQVGSCNFCKNGRYCAFENSSSTLPKMIQQTIRDGNITYSGMMKNPERINITCKKGCVCWDGSKCKRENGTCEKYND